MSLTADFGITGHLHKSAGPSENHSIIVKIGTTQLFLVFILNLDSGHQQGIFHICRNTTNMLKCQNHSQSYITDCQKSRIYSNLILVY